MHIPHTQGFSDLWHVADKAALAHSLTADTTDLLPHLPYLLQDIWEMGTPFETVRYLFANHIARPNAMRVLDLASGKGAVGIRLAREYGCRVTLVDALPDFLETAKEKADELGVRELCQFRVEDVTQTVTREIDWDCVLFLAAGNALGTPCQTLSALVQVVKPAGYMVIDETYTVDPDLEIQFAHAYPTLNEWREAYQMLGLQVIDTICDDSAAQSLQNDRNNEAIAGRARELAARFPEQADMFRRYVENQLAECQDLDNALESNLCLLQSRC